MVEQLASFCIYTIFCGISADLLSRALSQDLTTAPLEASSYFCLPQCVFVMLFIEILSVQIVSVWVFNGRVKAEGLYFNSVFPREIELK